MGSTQEGMASKKGGISPATGAAIRIEDGDGAAPEKKAPTKRKADTDCENREFELTLQERTVAATKNFRADNVR